MYSADNSGFKEALHHQLKRLFEDKKVISIFTDEDDTDSFSTGILFDVTDCSIILAQISSKGLYDGYKFIQVKNIYSIEYDGIYENKISTLYDIQKQKHKEIENLSNNSVTNLLEFAFLQKYVVSIELFESDLIDVEGIIENVDQEAITLKMIDKYGEFEGYKLININDITWMTFDTGTK